VSFTFPCWVFPSEARHQAGRVWRLARHGGRSLLAEGLRPPLNGLTFHAGGLYVSEGGPRDASAASNWTGSERPSWIIYLVPVTTTRTWSFSGLTASAVALHRTVDGS